MQAPAFRHGVADPYTNVSKVFFIMLKTVKMAKIKAENLSKIVMIPSRDLENKSPVLE